MSVWFAERIVAIGIGYAWVGLAVGIAFLLFGLDRLDPTARGAYAFRPLLLPGLVLLWPLVVWRWAGHSSGQGPVRSAQRRRHRLAWGTLAVLLPLILLGAAMQRATEPADPPIRLGPATR